MKYNVYNTHLTELGRVADEKKRGKKTLVQRNLVMHIKGTCRSVCIIWMSELQKNFFQATSQLLKLRLNCHGHIFIFIQLV